MTKARIYSLLFAAALLATVLGKGGHHGGFGGGHPFGF